MTRTRRNRIEYRRAIVLLAGLFLCCRCRAESQVVGPQEFTIGNATIAVTLNAADGALSVTDKRTGQTWRQKSTDNVKIVKIIVSMCIDGGIDLTWRPDGLGADLEVQLRIDGEKPEFTVAISAKGGLKGTLGYPYPFVSQGGAYLVVPMNEGISYPVDDESIEPMWLVAYGGHGICMAFWGVTDGEAGHTVIIETPDDALIQINRLEGRLCVAPRWESQKGDFGYTRKLRYVFFDKGGHVAMCKRYRQYAQQIGRLKTLDQKRQENPNVDLLIGAVNLWCWENDALAIVREMKSAGIDRILWSNRASPEVIKAMN